jgi:hypothetical protein
VLKPVKRFFRGIARIYRRVNNFLERHPWLFYTIAGIFIAGAGWVRFWAAPISAGPDVGQFWGFARLFQIHGLDFYRYADGNDPLLPTQGWGYVYPPIWLLVCRVALFFAAGSMATSDLVDSSWRLAMKTPIMAADLAIGALLIWTIPGSRIKKLFFGFIWLFHPTAWYNSAVFGQFDAIAAALLLISLILLLRGRDRWGFVFAGLAILTKQHAAIPALLMIAVVGRNISKRRLLENCAILAGVFVVFSLPFIFNGNLVNYGRSVLFPAQSPAYQLPLVFAFSGSGALLTYFHEAFKWNTERFLMANSPILIASVIAGAILCYVKKIRLEQAALAGILLFIGIFYRINYQYLVIYIPLAILALAMSQKWIERALLFGLIVIPAVWMWLYNTSFWFWYLRPHPPDFPKILERIGFTNYVSDQFYVSLAGVLMVFAIAYAWFVLLQRRKPALPDFRGR